MIKKTLKIKPSDTLFFRTGKPLSGGEWADTMLFPNPSVVWGSVFSMMITHGLIDKENLKGKKEIKQKELDKLRIGRIYIQKEQSLYLPAPQDIYSEKEKPSNQGVFQLAAIDNRFLSNTTLETGFYLKPQTSNVIEAFDNSFIENRSFQGNNYQFQKTGSFAIEASSHFAIEVPKLGIQRNNTTRTAEEGMLYRANASQIKENVYLIIEIFICEELNDKFPVSNILKLGSEGKIVEFTDETNENVSKKIVNSDSRIQKKLNTNLSLFRLYIQSPTIFNSGNGIKELNEAGFEVFAMSMNKFQKIGGYDIEKNMPKPMQKAIPAGTIYFIKNKNNYDYKKLNDLLSSTLNTDRYGFGQFQILNLTNQS
jgi:CRISPR-associated protein Cmr3